MCANQGVTVPARLQLKNAVTCPVTVEVLEGCVNERWNVCVEVSAG